MTIWMFLAFNACAVMWSGLLLWAYYAGSKQISPVPHVTLPSIAGIFRRKAKGTNENGEAEATIPASVRRA